MNRSAPSRPTFASFYDFYDGGPFRQEQLAMYRSLAGEAGERVIELACGTGIIAIDLARAGFQVTGLDISPEMLAVAREKLAREAAGVQLRIRLVEGDMKDFKLEGSFDAVFLTSNSFGYLTDLDDQRSCLRAVHDHLRCDGTLVVEERHYPPPVLMRTWQARLVPTVQMSRVNPATGKYTSFNWVTTHIDFASQTIRSRSHIDEIQEDGTLRRYASDNTMTQRHYFHRFELQLLIEQAGFEVTALWGGHGRQGLDPQSYNMIFTARKP